MNKKLINHIAFDCYSTRDNDFNTVKFAKLIIKECASICDKIEDDYLETKDSDYMHMAIGAGVCCTEILNHFGIEE